MTHGLISLFAVTIVRIQIKLVLDMLKIFRNHIRSLKIQKGRQIFGQTSNLKSLNGTIRFTKKHFICLLSESGYINCADRRDIFKSIFK